MLSRLLTFLSFVVLLCLASCAGQQSVQVENTAPVATPTPAASSTPARKKFGGGHPFGDPAKDKFELGQKVVLSNLLGDIVYEENMVSPTDLALIKEQSIGNISIKSIGPDSMVEQETIDAFVAANAETTKWTTGFDVKLQHKIVPADKIPPMGSQEFKAKFPKTKCVVGLSRVGFNKEWTQALAMTEVECEQAAKQISYWLIYADEDGAPAIQRLASQ